MWAVLRSLATLVCPTPDPFNMLLKVSWELALNKASALFHGFLALEKQIAEGSPAEDSVSGIGQATRKPSCPNSWLPRVKLNRAEGERASVRCKTRVTGQSPFLKSKTQSRTRINSEERDCRQPNWWIKERKGINPPRCTYDVTTKNQYRRVHGRSRHCF